MAAPEVLIAAGDIAAAVVRLAGEIAGEYRSRNPVLLVILKGSFIFAADLVRRLDFPLEVEFIRASSYGGGTVTSGRVRVDCTPRTSLRGRHVLVVEDIVDTGLTTSFVMDYVRRRRPASLRLCALLDKPARRRVPLPVDYLGFSVPDRFLVGYGLDFDERYRNLPDICVLEEG